MKEIEQSRTPEALYSAIEKYSAESEDLSRESAYREARNALIRFRKVSSKLPALPDHQENAVAGLQDVMDWCVRAIDIVDLMIDDMDRGVIEGFIRKLNKLKRLPALGFPKIHKDVWKKAEDRARRICDKYQTGKKRPRGLGTFNYCSRRTRFLYTASIISSLADVADRKAGKPNRWSHLLACNSITTDRSSKQIEDAYTKMDFYRAVEKIYRLMDSDYTAALATLEERISVVFEEWNKMNDTTTGDLLDKYDELKGIKLQDRVVRLASAYSIDSIVNTALFGLNSNSVFGGEARETLVDGVIETLCDISRKIKEKTRTKQSKNGGRAEGSTLMISVRSSKENWEAIRGEYGISKRDFGKKINFVSDLFKRKVIFRDVEHAFVLTSEGFAKPAVILAGGVIEELLRLYLKHKNIAAADNTFNEYIKACEQNKLLQTGIGKLSDSAREFRNFVHLSKESTKKHSITKAAAKGAVSSIFTIANDL
jgi:hypothetical protein